MHSAVLPLLFLVGIVSGDVIPLLFNFHDFLNETQLINSVNVNHQFKTKALKYLKGNLQPKAPLPSERESHWINMRKLVNSSEHAVPVHKYLSAYEDLQKLSSHKRSTYTLRNMQSIGPTTGKNDGGRTRALLVQGNSAPYTLIAGGVAGGIWKSTNSGTSWTLVTDLLPNIAISCLAANPNQNPSQVMYAGTGEGYFMGDSKRGAGIFRSSDYGASTSSSDFWYVNKIAISSNNPNILYAATRTGVFKTTNNGISFSSILTLPSGSPGALEMAVFGIGGKDYIYAWVASFGLYVSMDGGSTWTRKFGNSAGDMNWFRGAIGVSPSSPNRAYVSVSTFPGIITGIWKTDDFGNSWNQVLKIDNSPTGKLNKLLLSNAVFGFDTGNGKNCFQSASQQYSQGWYDNVVGVDPTNPDRVFVGGVDLWRSDDAGISFGLISTWWSGTSGIYLHADQHAIVFSPNFREDSMMFVGNDGGIAVTSNPFGEKSTNPCTGVPGVSWSQRNEGYSTIQFYHGSVALHGDIYLGGSQDNGSWKYRTGTTWDKVDGGDGGYSAIDFSTPSRYYTSNTGTSITRHDSRGSISILSSGQLGGISSFINPYIMDASNSKVLFTCNEKVWTTSDATALNVQWTSLGTLDPPGSATKPTAMTMAQNSRIIYIGDERGRFWKLVPGSQPVLTGSGIPGGTISSITVDPKIENIIYVTISSFGLPHLMKSTNGGSSFSSIGNIPDVPCLSLFVHPDDNRVLYLGTDLGILYSENSGSNFVSINNYGFATTPANWFVYQNSTKTLIVFTHGRGAYKVNVALN